MATEKRVNIQLKPGKISRQNTVTRATGVLNEDGSVFLRYRGNDYHDWASLVEKELPDADFYGTATDRTAAELDRVVVEEQSVTVASTTMQEMR